MAEKKVTDREICGPHASNIYSASGPKFMNISVSNGPRNQGEQRLGLGVCVNARQIIFENIENGESI